MSTELLQQEIGKWQSRGFKVTSQTDTSPQLTKPKEFSFLWFIFTLGFYLIYHIAFKRERGIYLYVEGDQVKSRSQR